MLAQVTFSKPPIIVSVACRQWLGRPQQAAHVVGTVVEVDTQVFQYRLIGVSNGVVERAGRRPRVAAQVGQPFSKISPASPRSGSPAPRVNCAIARGVKLRPMFSPQPPTATVCRNAGNTCRPNASIVSNRSSPRWTGDSKIRWSIPMRSASRMSSRTCSILPRNGSRCA